MQAWHHQYSSFKGGPNLILKVILHHLITSKKGADKYIGSFLMILSKKIIIIQKKRKKAGNWTESHTDISFQAFSAESNFAMR